MASMAEQYEGNFLTGLDLPEGVSATVTIAALAEPGTQKDSAGKIIKKGILSFTGKNKMLILNTTNYLNLKTILGLDPADWIGKEIHIQRRYLKASQAFGVHNTMCIRIVMAKGAPISGTAAKFMGSVKPHPAE